MGVGADPKRTMSWRRMNPQGRAFATTVALLLFLSGSNFCLITVLAGGSMACLSAPGAGHDRMPSHCRAHARPATDPGGSRAPLGTGGSPCCVSLAMVASPQVEKAELLSGPLPELNAASALRDPQASIRFTPAPEQNPPPLPDVASRHSGRAPPLS